MRGLGAIGSKLHPRGKYESIVDHSAPMADKGGKKISGYIKSDQSAVCAIRVFGMRKYSISGPGLTVEMEQRFR